MRVSRWEMRRRSREEGEMEAGTSGGMINEARARDARRDRGEYGDERGETER